MSLESSLKILTEVSNDLERLLELDEGYDVIINSGEKENVKEFHALSNILRIRSQYLRNELTKVNVEKSDGKFILKLPNISPHIFQIILRFIYCGKIDMTKLEGPGLLNLLIAANTLNLQTLVSIIEECLINDHHEFLQQNPIGTLEIIYQNENFATLWNFYLEKICEEPETFFNSDKFIDIKAPLLELLLKRDDLGLEEIDIWNSLIKWGHAQNPSIPKDVKKWSKEETTIMERTLHRCIPLVRFHYISSDDFLEKVLPFRDLLPREMYDTTLAFYLSTKRKLNTEIQPPRLSKNVYDSILVKSQHFAIFSSWIDKKNKLHYNIKNLPYSFNLIYRASKDGMTPAAFHQKCDNKGATIIIIKIEGTKQIIGGYNPIEWDSSNFFKKVAISFIFSFKNLETVNVGYSNGNTNAIGCFSGYGPLFGQDLRYNPDSIWSSSQNNAYSKVEDIPAEFIVDDYEVFQVIKK